MSTSAATDDPFHLQRFVAAQEDSYETALAEIAAGCKVSHWMWYIFPQVAGLGHSSMSRRYAIGGVAEAQAYLEHPVLGPRLTACAEAALSVPDKTVYEIFGSPDDLKLKSSATLFAHVAPPGSVFEQLLDRFYGGEADAKTLQLLKWDQFKT
jgi:uncharacterized protein (DUF1810 family)